MSNVIKDTIDELDMFERLSDNKIILEKLDGVRSAINEVTITEINDDVVSRVLTISRLKNELGETADG